MKISSLYGVQDKVGESHPSIAFSDWSTELTHISPCTAVVTGGGSGIGAMFASAFVQNGAKVYIGGKRKDVVEKAAQAFRPASNLGGSLVP